MWRSFGIRFGIIVALAAAAAFIGHQPHVLAQSNPNLQFGQVPTAAQWNSYFSAKQDYRGGCGSIPVPAAGCTIQVAVRSTNAATVAASPTSDYFLCLDPTANPINVQLPTSPPLGVSFLIKDCTGQAATNNITVTPASGNIDNAPSFVMSTALQSIAVTFTGLQWSIN